jgi:hypothetical protein
MPTPWVILERRFGDSIHNPSMAELSASIRELYHENLPGLTAGDNEEHGSASLRYGYDDGPMFVIAVTRSGVVTFEEWSDQDYGQEVRPPLSRESVPEHQALDLFKRLARGEINVLRVLVEKGPA